MLDWAARHTKWLTFWVLLAAWIGGLNWLTRDSDDFGGPVLVAGVSILVMPIALVVVPRWSQRRADRRIVRRSYDS